MIVVIDYGMGNLRSIQKGYERLKINVKISSDPLVIQDARKLILPGVGHFKHGMNHLIESGLLDTLNKKVIEDKVPILGICLGMQLFSNHSEEGNSKGLGWIDAESKVFSFNRNQNLKIPHMGWNSIKKTRENPLIIKTDIHEPFYFVHSYYVNWHLIFNYFFIKRI